MRPLPRALEEDSIVVVTGVTGTPDLESRAARQLSRWLHVAVARTSARNLARLFAQHAHCSPLDYVQRMRIAAARELLTQSDLDLERVAEKAGFNSAHQLRRVWRRWEAVPPSELRA